MRFRIMLKASGPRRKTIDLLGLRFLCFSPRISKGGSQYEIGAHEPAVWNIWAVF
jgi:hypothetical protein